MIKKSVLLGILCVSLLVVLSGCFGDSIAIPLGDGQSINVNRGDDGFDVSYKGEDGVVDISANEEDGLSISGVDKDGKEGSIQFSQNMPELFPDYIPLPNTYEIMSSTQYSADDGKGVMVQLAVEGMTEKEAIDKYTQFMNSHNYHSDFEMKSDNRYVINMSKDLETIMIEIAEQDSGVTILIYVEEQPENE